MRVLKLDHTLNGTEGYPFFWDTCNINMTWKFEKSCPTDATRSIYPDQLWLLNILQALPAQAGARSVWAKRNTRKTDNATGLGAPKTRESPSAVCPCQAWTEDGDDGVEAAPSSFEECP